MLGMFRFMLGFSEAPYFNSSGKICLLQDLSLATFKDKNVKNVNVKCKEC